MNIDKLMIYTDKILLHKIPNNLIIIEIKCTNKIERHTCRKLDRGREMSTINKVCEFRIWIQTEKQLKKVKRFFLLQE